MNFRLLLLLFVLTGWPALAETAPDNRVVTISTQFGEIVIQMDPVAAPKSCAAFEHYIQQQVYHGSAFHFCDGHFIQGGKPGASAQGYAGDGNFPFPDAPPAEFNLKNVRGAVGLGRMCDSCNPTKCSNSTQFYILTVDWPKDDNQYSVFGHVIRGMEVVDQIAALRGKSKDGKFKVDLDVKIEKADPAL